MMIKEYKQIIKLLRTHNGYFDNNEIDNKENNTKSVQDILRVEAKTLRNNSKILREEANNIRNDSKYLEKR